MKCTSACVAYNQIKGEKAYRLAATTAQMMYMSLVLVALGPTLVVSTVAASFADLEAAGFVGFAVRLRSACLSSCKRDRYEPHRGRGKAEVGYRIDHLEE